MVVCALRCGRALALLAFLCCPSLVAAGETPFAPPRHLRLPNGLQVYLHPGPARGEPVHLRLIVAVGSDHEGEGEGGWAHLIEHLAFRRTARFDSAAIAALGAHGGARPGRDLNAATGRRHTVYRLRAPAGDAVALGQRLALLADWLGAPDFRPAALALEARIIRAEQIEFGADLRLHRRWQAALYTGESVAAPARSEPAAIAALTAFHRRHYRAGAAQLLVTGDFDPRELIAPLVRALSAVRPGGAAPPPPAPRLRPVVRGTDPAVSAPRVALAQLLTVGDSGGEAAMVLLMARVARDAGPCGAPRFGAEAVAGGRRLVSVSLSAAAGERVCLRRLMAAAQALAGAPPATWREQLAAALDQLPSYRAARSALRRADHLERALIAALPPHDAAQRVQQLRDWAHQAGPAAIAAALRQALGERRPSAVLQRPPGDRRTLPAAAAVAAWWALPSLPAPLATAPDAAAPTSRPAPVAAVFESGAAGGRYRRWRYANGAELHAWRSAAVSGHFDALAVREGGLLSLPRNWISAAAALPHTLPEQGLPALGREALQQLRRERGVGLQWFVENTRQGVAISALRRDARWLFELLHRAHLPLAHFAAPAPVAERPGSALRRAIFEQLYGEWADSPAASPGISPAASPGISPAVGSAGEVPGLAAQRRLFAGAEGLRVYLAGDLDWDQVAALGAHYIGSLPAGAASAVAPLRASGARGALVQRGNRAGRADLHWYLVQAGGDGLERRDAALLLLREWLSERLWQALRQRQGLAYDVAVTLRRRPLARGGSALHISTVCEPAQVARIQAAVDQSLAQMLEHGPAEAELAPLRERLVADYRALLADNASLLHEWASQDERGAAPVAFRHTAARIAALDAPALARFARRFLGASGMLRVSVLPERAAAGGERVDARRPIGE